MQTNQGMKFEKERNRVTFVNVSLKNYDDVNADRQIGHSKE